MALNQIIYELQDMTHLSWAKTRNSSGTAGSFLKAYEDGADGKGGDEADQPGFADLQQHNSCKDNK